MLAEAIEGPGSLPIKAGANRVILALTIENCCRRLPCIFDKFAEFATVCGSATVVKLHQSRMDVKQQVQAVLSGKPNVNIFNLFTQIDTFN